jgi:small-conductance mechanosensitive channel
VLPEPPPCVDFEAFGASGLELDVQVWIREPRAQGRIRSDLNYRIEAALRQAGVEVPFPQQDLHLRSPQLDRIVDALRGDGAAPRLPMAG